MTQDTATSTNKGRIVGAVETLIDAAKGSIDDKLGAMDSKIKCLKDDMKGVKGLLATQEKRQRLEFAISCSSLQEFKYISEDGMKTTSSALVQKILKWFVLGYGFHLPADAIVMSTSNNEKRTREELFRLKLMKQLENLIGHKPRLVNNGKGSFTIFYE